MQLRFRCLGTLSLLLTFLLLPSFVPASAKFFLCSSQSWGVESKTFGENGRDGNKGKNGQKGEDSENITIFADGSPMTLDLSGGSGSNGEMGSSGGNAVCNDPPTDSDRNLHGSDGGNGGDGGDGGDGGNGGALTVYTTNLDYLKQIYVSTVGGQGGQPGAGGNSGQGCQCKEAYSTQQVCQGSSCNTRQSKCQDGLSGNTGREGRPGKEGKMGRLTLVTRDRTLETERQTATVKMSEIKDRGLTLSKNIWENRTGAASLFVPTSNIADEYTILVDRLERSALIAWDAPRPFKDFANTPVTLAFGDRGQIDLTVPKDVWLETRRQEYGNITQIFIANAVKESEVTKLESQGLFRNGTGLHLNLTDVAEQSDLVLTDFQLVYRINRSEAAKYRRVFDYDKVYEGKIAPEIITYNNNNFSIDLGKLPIKPDFFKPGIAVEIELIAKRSFAGHSTEQTVFVRQILK
jgi:hypothetical protein